MTFDYNNPNYTDIIVHRAKHLQFLRDNPNAMAAAKVHYKTHPWDFINDWGVTFDPRNLEAGLITEIPFVLWPKQKEYLEWIYNLWQNSRVSGGRGLVEKSRDCGVTWLSVGFACAMWCNVPGFVTGFGSRKAELVDKRGDDKSIFEKARFFINRIPQEFLPPDYNPRLHSNNMNIMNPNTGAAIIGEGGDSIGRGGRTSIYLVDEAAFVEHQEQVDAALSQNTNCQIDISTVNGTGNAFHKKRLRYEGTDKLFIFDWRDDPRKDQEWYDRQVAELDPVVVAQEIDRDYAAAAEDIFIPAKWVKASIDAHKILGFEPQGIRVTGFDPADTGDAKAYANREGSVVTQAEMRKDGDITDAIPWAMNAADKHRSDVFTYDADGMGGPALKVTLQHVSVGRMPVVPYHGSGKVVNPDRPYIYSEDDNSHPDASAYIRRDGLRTNKECFANYRAQTWTSIRDRFRRTFEAVNAHRDGKAVRFDPDTLISIDSRCINVHELVAELARPKRKWSMGASKILVEAKKDMKARKVASPNLADALVMAFAIDRVEVVKKATRRPINYVKYNDPTRI